MATLLPFCGPACCGAEMSDVRRDVMWAPFLIHADRSKVEHERTTVNIGGCAGTQADFER